MSKEKEFRPSDIVLVRHGESLWNLHGREMKRKGIPPPEMEGVPDHLTSLTPKGLRQARETAEALVKEFGTFDAIYHSAYLRTEQTVEAMVSAVPAWSGLRLYRELLLVEQLFGRLDVAVHPGDNREEYLRLRREFTLQKETKGKFYATPPDGESWFRVCLRTHDFLGKLFRPQWHGKKILVVSHAVTIATFYYHLHGRNEEETVANYQQNELENCAVVHFRHNPKSEWNWDLVDWNKIFWNKEE